MPHTPRSERATTRKPETAPPRIATCTASTRLRRAAAAVRTLERTLMNMPMMPEAIEQAAPTRKATAVMIPIGAPARSGTSATSRVSTMRDHQADDHRADEGQQPDRRVLALDEGVGALADRVAHVLHRLRPLVTREDVAGQVEGEGNGHDPGDGDHPGDQLHETSEGVGVRVRRWRADRTERCDTRKSPAECAVKRPPARRAVW